MDVVVLVGETVSGLCADFVDDTGVEYGRLELTCSRCRLHERVRFKVAYLETTVCRSFASLSDNSNVEEEVDNAVITCLHRDALGVSKARERSQNAIFRDAHIV